MYEAITFPLQARLGFKTPHSAVLHILLYSVRFALIMESSTELSWNYVDTPMTVYYQAQTSEQIGLEADMVHLGLTPLWLHSNTDQ